MSRAKKDAAMKRVFLWQAPAGNSTILGRVAACQQSLVALLVGRFVVGRSKPSQLERFGILLALVKRHKVI